ncbi:hypothetical protein IV494_08240 [Kaistella sp. G5-32]|uniref:Uncharacterized protein n=1 Tax=Kaistella gelatinilytica TaxID=2787636 RepID=A0ABS0FBX0_9FLAO|nr:hypothetical protein [Kaistella gelatinilytica]MBF8457171.1 hypothetical protein [Kaistella gelatinilytica]
MFLAIANFVVSSRSRFATDEKQQNGRQNSKTRYEIKKIQKTSGYVLVLFAIFRLVNPDLTKSINIQDCKSEYKMSVFGPEYNGFRYHKAKMEVDKCFYKKYIQNYKLETSTRKVETTTCKENTITFKENTTTRKENTTTCRENTTTCKVDTTTRKENTTTRKENTTTRKENTSTRKENTTTRKENTTTRKENTTARKKNYLTSRENNLPQTQKIYTKKNPIK